MKKLRILFVCLGNICRSTMAEFAFRTIIEQHGLERQIEIQSAGTSAEEVGNPVHPGTRAILAANGIPCAGKTAVQLTAEDYNRYDLLIGMEDANVRAMRRIFNGDPQRKIYKLLDFTPQGRDIVDPWYTRNFQATWQDVNEGLNALLQKLFQEGHLQTKEHKG